MITEIQSKIKTRNELRLPFDVMSICLIEETKRKLEEKHDSVVGYEIEDGQYAVLVIEAIKGCNNCNWRKEDQCKIISKKIPNKYYKCSAYIQGDTYENKAVY